MKNYCLVMYSGQNYPLTEVQFQKFGKVIEDINQKFLHTPWGVLAINDIRYAGEIENAPESKTKHYIPAEQKKIQDGDNELPFSPLALLSTGEIVAKTPEAELAISADFRAKAKKQWELHVCSYPAMNKAMEVLRQQAHKSWMRMAQLSTADKQARYIADTKYSEPEKAIFHKYKITY